MNIVFSAANHHQIQPLAAAFVAAGDNVVIWNPHKKPINDMLDEAKPNLLFHPYVRKGYEMEVDYLKQHGCQSLFLTNDSCANIAQFWKGTPNTKYAADLLYISDIQVTQDIIKYLLECREGYKLRIIGQYPVSMPEYVGVPTIRNIADSIKSCNTILDYHGHWEAEAYRQGKGYYCAYPDVKKQPSTLTSFELAALYLNELNLPTTDYLFAKQKEIMS